MKMYGMTTPQGDDIYYEDQSWLKEKMLNAAQEFWKSGCGMAAVESGRDKMHFFFHQDFGFSFHYIEQDDFGNWRGGYISWMKEEFGRAVEDWAGGNPVFHPEAEFIPRDLAFQVVKDFCEKGTRSSRIRWVKIDDRNWDSDKGKPTGPPPNTFAPWDDRDLQLPAEGEINQVVVGTHSGWILTIAPDGSAEITLANWLESSARSPAGTFKFAKVRDELQAASSQGKTGGNSWFVTFVRSGKQNFPSEKVDEATTKKVFRQALKAVVTKDPKFDELLQKFSPAGWQG